MFRTVYTVRVVEDGKLVLKKRFYAKDRAFNLARDKLGKGRRASIAQGEDFELSVRQNTEWVEHGHDWKDTTGDLKMVFIHTSVTKQLPETASVADERAEMRGLDAIAHARGFNGFSYSWAVFPSGRCWEGRGWGVVEAASAPHNTTSDSIVLVGNNDAFPVTRAQWEAVRRLIERGQKYGHLAKSALDVRGHREIAAKACPGRYVTDSMLHELQRKVNA